MGLGKKGRGGVEGSTLPHIFLCELVDGSQDKLAPFMKSVLVVAAIKGENASQFNLASQNSVRGVL